MEAPVSPPGARGVSLAETLIAVAVLLILAGTAVPVAFRATEIREERQLETRAAEIGRALLAFHADRGAFPTRGRGLTELVEDPGAGIWLGPYLTPAGAGIGPLVDPRGGSFVYERSADHVVLRAEGFPGWSQTIGVAVVEHERAVRARRELGIVASAAERYRRARGGYPTSAAVLAPDFLGEDLLRDPWGRRYRMDASLEVPWSTGPDGRGPTSDDVFPIGFAPERVPWGGPRES
ncbi:MAG: hypothetical protein GY716_09225 [bacterium]|nr:hypothetical protein [bacterium]